MGSDLANRPTKPGVDAKIKKDPGIHEEPPIKYPKSAESLLIAILPIRGVPVAYWICENLRTSVGICVPLKGNGGLVLCSISPGPHGSDGSQFGKLRH